VLNSVVKISVKFAKYFKYCTIILGGAFFVDVLHSCSATIIILNNVAMLQLATPKNCTVMWRQCYFRTVLKLNVSTEQCLLCFWWLPSGCQALNWWYFAQCSKWSSKVYHFQKCAFLLSSWSWLWRQHRRNCRIRRTKTNKMVFSTENLVLIKVLRQEKVYDNWWMITLLIY